MSESSRLEYLSALGIGTWHLRGSRAPVIATATATATPTTVMQPTSEAIVAPAATGSPVRAEDVAGMDWNQLRSCVAGCTRCVLHETRTQTVFGIGDPSAHWLFVGEAPGAEEDRRGEPFVGRAGQLLNSMLLALGLAREQVFIANVLKCRPPGNRDPRPEEARSCADYLNRQIALIGPKIMVAVGRIAAQNLLGSDAPLGKMRQQLHAFGPEKVPLIVTYHPAYLLRSPGEKRKAWEDLKFARRVMERGSSQS